MALSGLASALDTALRGRRSIRSYEDRPVPESLVREVMDAARHAPSPHHSVPWRFAVLTGIEVRTRLAEAMGERWREDLAADGLPPEGIEAEVGKSRRRLLQAPLIVVGSLYLEPLDSYPDPHRQQAETLMAAHSLGAALQNLMLAAHARGLASCWMCAPVFCPEVVRDALHLGPELIPHALLTIGYGARPPPERERPGIEQIVTLWA
jgi:coenzyme F420-0:L-glutamate ligase/coenzyme F420-1:gamma-L-glutamate ligase